MKKQIKVNKTMYINGVFDKSSINNTDRTVVLSFSSEKPYLRWFGWEIVDSKEMDLSRLNNKAILLFNHNWDDYIGVVEKAWISEDNRCYAKVRFDEHEQSNKILNSIKTGILPGVSFGYEINKAYKIDDIDGTEAYRVAVTPFEISVVTVPADPTVGYGRSFEEKEKNIQISITICNEEEEEEEEDIESIEDDKKDEKKYNNSKKTIDNNLNFNKVNNDNIQSFSINMEKKMDRNEINAKIAKLGKQYGATDLALDYIEKNNTSVEEFTEALLSKRSSSPSIQDSSIDDYEKEDYSLGLALKQLMTGNVSGIVKDVNKEMEKKHGARRSENSILIPFNALKKSVTTSANNSLVQSSLSMTPIESLYNSLAVVQAGATYMTDLVGNVDIPRFDNVISAQYVNENASATGSELSSDLVTMSGKDLTANIDISRKMRLQTPYNIQALCADQLFQAIRQKMDLDSLIGSGTSGQVKGVLNQTGVNSVVTEGGAGLLTWKKIIELESKVKASNALISKGAYITTSKIEGLMKGTQKGNGLGFIYENGLANNYNVYTTNGLPEVGTTAKTSSIIFGDWSQLLIGNWGAIELQYDPYTNSKTGQNSLTIFVTFDTAVRHAKSFSAMNEILI